MKLPMWVRVIAWTVLASYLLVVLGAMACGEFRIVAVNFPYCPVSDSAKAKADSIPAICMLPDTVSR